MAVRSLHLCNRLLQFEFTIVGSGLDCTNGADDLLKLDRLWLLIAAGCVGRGDNIDLLLPFAFGEDF